MDDHSYTGGLSFLENADFNVETSYTAQQSTLLPNPGTQNIHTLLLDKATLTSENGFKQITLIL